MEFLLVAWLGAMAGMMFASCLKDTHVIYKAKTGGRMSIRGRFYEVKDLGPIETRETGSSASPGEKDK
ncbi:MAG: hypothetical protein HN976_16520 [Lentisphaerae bacterium]|jgi:hypothetical protein|nr:hypothetical protein [Lentisphaerota bacterium]MBT7056696.1 hypothetical protein [Lentisphaerota bacterium]